VSRKGGGDMFPRNVDGLTGLHGVTDKLFIVTAVRSSGPAYSNFRLLYIAQAKIPGVARDSLKMKELEK
jgi:hypothetical protein